MSEKRCNICTESFPATTEYFKPKASTPDKLSKCCRRCLDQGAPKKGRPTPRVRVNGEGITELRCSTCKEWLPATTEHFYRKVGETLDLSKTCRICQRRFVAGYWQKASPEFKARNARKSKEIQRRQAAIRTRNRAVERAWKTACALAIHSEREAARVQKRALAEQARLTKAQEKQERREQSLRKRRERHHIYEKRYRQSEKGRRVSQVATQKKRARRQQLPNTLTTAEWNDCLDYFGYSCAVCGAQANLFTTLAQDHWIPITYAGDGNPGTVAENIVPLCHSQVAGVRGCNDLKSNQNAHDWLVSTYGARKASGIEKRIHAYFVHVSEQTA